MASDDEKTRSFHSLVTDVRNHNSSQIFKIENFSRRVSKFCSSIFPAEEDCRTRWQIQIDFKGKTFHFIHVKVIRKDKYSDTVFVNFILRLENTEGEPFFQEKKENWPFHPDATWEVRLGKPLTRLQCSKETELRKISFQLKEDDVFVIKIEIDVKHCCFGTNMMLQKYNYEDTDLLLRISDEQRGIGFADSKSYEHGCQIQWKINRFSRLKETFLSPNFFPVEDCATKWRLVLDFRDVAGSIERMYVKIQRMDYEVGRIISSFLLNVQNSSGNVIHQDTVNRFPCEPGAEWRISLCRPYEKSILLVQESNDIHSYIQDDIIIINALIFLDGCCKQSA